MSEQQNNQPAGRAGGRRRFWIGATVAAVIGTVTLGACGHRGGGWHGHSSDPSERISHAVDRIFSRVDATDEQKTQITQIAQDAYRELAPLRDEMRDARKQALQLLTAEQVDRGALEQLRSDRMAKADKATVTASDALADIAEVLTPEQRTQVREKLAARMEKRRHKRW